MIHRLLLALLAVLAVLSTPQFGVAETPSVTFVTRPSIDQINQHYVSNRVPLVPSSLIGLPVGSVEPDGWLRVYLEKQRDGLTGNLGRISAWLQKDDNAWLSKDGKGKWGWEELPYWLKGYGEIAYRLDDPEMIAETKIWIEGALNSQRPNGDFGPDHRMNDGSRDYWANMIMLYCLQSYYEYAHDERVLDLMAKYFHYQGSVADEAMLTGYWQHMRGGDNLYSIYWLYNRTGDKSLLEVAEKMHRNTADWRMNDTLPNWHNVNVAQAFGEPATYYLQTHDPQDLQAAYNNFHEIRRRYGQVPGGMFGGDENCREGFDDPRQCVETCGMVEQMLSDELLTQITGDTFWADNCEDVAFNTYPAAVMPDFRSLRYLTGPNMVISDQQNHHPGIDNGGPFMMMNPFSSRCCQHNHSHGWPYYARNLWAATPDNGVCASMYCESKVNVKVGDGTEVTLSEQTHYPFDEQIQITVNTPKRVTFPLYMRIPAWCNDAQLSINGERINAKLSGAGYAKIDRTWNDGDKVTLRLPMQIRVRNWKQNHDSVSVDFGPLTFSLRIDEQYVKFESTSTAIGDSKWQDGVDTAAWPSWEIHPQSPWNYGLVLNADDPKRSFELLRGEWPADDFPFTLDSVPWSMRVKAKRIPQWTVDRHGLCAELQDSPVSSHQPIETVTLVPMGAARLRISAFPVIGEGERAHKWTAPAIPQPPLYDASASHVHGSDSADAMCDSLEPKRSGDQATERMTWWDHRGSEEWAQYDFAGPREVSEASVYWFDDTGKGECRVPASWKLLYRDSGEWKSVQLMDRSKYGTQQDQFNVVAFKPVTTDALRLVVKLRDGFSGGVLEWKVR
ncbi:beta-L-arabinofuranosidase domain-containing protein [Novipirellula artificiosorum]|uniref:Beta-L-arabinobiosidase n=1 Tax=Novipirellula artificiosorum TaxID=2528016 RepID=A0A5C6DIK0_9BACT|nr:beta-L-arabinofuranosidase domain-containing protein [Novipirellula artificiosorum]TWU35914.1 Beta-L-arabinobiosidase precursor [Novipirellula artificiosorum]